MANRQQNYQSGSQGRRDYRSSEDENRYSRDNERDHDRDYRESNSVRSTSYDQGRGQSGYSDYGNVDQDRYGQSGHGQGGRVQSNYGSGRSRYGEERSRYGEEYGSSGTSNYGRSSYGGYSGAGSYGSQGWQEPYGEGQQYGSPGSGQGMHRGKGPKNYQRSDERLKEMLCERLREDPHIDASEVTVNVQGGRITLEGSVDSRQAKNAIEEVADQLGIEDVQNNLRVTRAGQQSTSSMTRSASSAEDGEASKSKRN
jgi:osmotically-inducible protein OsmY